MLINDQISLEIHEMNKIIRDPFLMATCRRLSHGGGSGMNQALDHYQTLDRSIDARGIFANLSDKYIGWALCTRETDIYYYKPVPGTAAFQIYVDPTYRRKGIGRMLLRKAKSLVPNEDLLVYGNDGHYFFGALMNEGLCSSIYERDRR